MTRAHESGQLQPKPNRSHLSILEKTSNKQKQPHRKTYSYRIDTIVSTFTISRNASGDRFTKERKKGRKRGPSRAMSGLEKALFNLKVGGVLHSPLSSSFLSFVPKLRYSMRYFPLSNPPADPSVRDNPCYYSPLYQPCSPS